MLKHLTLLSLQVWKKNKHYQANAAFNVIFTHLVQQRLLQHNKCQVANVAPWSSVQLPASQLTFTLHVASHSLVSGRTAKKLLSFIIPSPPWGKKVTSQTCALIRTKHSWKKQTDGMDDLCYVLTKDVKCMQPTIWKIMGKKVVTNEGWSLIRVLFLLSLVGHFTLTISKQAKHSGSRINKLMLKYKKHRWSR